MNYFRCGGGSGATVIIDGVEQDTDLKLVTKSVDYIVSNLPINVATGDAVILNNKIYIAKGTGFWMYDSTKWSSLSSLPFSFAYEKGKLIVLNNEIHLFGSDDKLHYKYNGTNWIKVGTIPFVTITSYPAVVFNGEIHTFFFNNWIDEHWKYNGTSWTKVGSAPFQPSKSFMFVLNGEIHLFGGTYGEKYHYTYNGTSWTKVADMNISFSRSTVNGAVYNGKLHIVGSNNHYIYTNGQFVETTKLFISVLQPLTVVFDNAIHVLAKGIYSDNEMYHMAVQTKFYRKVG